MSAPCGRSRPTCHGPRLDYGEREILLRREDIFLRRAIRALRHLRTKGGWVGLEDPVEHAIPLLFEEDVHRLLQGNSIRAVQAEWSPVRGSITGRVTSLRGARDLSAPAIRAQRELKKDDGLDSGSPRHSDTFAKMFISLCKATPEAVRADWPPSGHDHGDVRA